MARPSSDHLAAAFRYSPRYSRVSERESIAESKRNWTKNFTIKDNKNTYVIAVAIALLIASVLLVTTYLITPKTNQGYMTIDLLDSNKKAADYPESLVANVNSTFSVFVEVENHMGKTVNETVLVKIVSDLNPTFPIDVNATQTFNNTLKDGATTENVTTISLNQPGNYFVVFELWVQNQKTGELQYTNEFVSLNVQVTAETNSTTPAPS
jgi:uncharacterized membrane protein